MIPFLPDFASPHRNSFRLPAPEMRRAWHRQAHLRLMAGSKIGPVVTKIERLNFPRVRSTITPSLQGAFITGGKEMPAKQLLIIGAGPYGLSAAAYAKHLGIDYAIAGKPMEFWRTRMPKGMLLRSGSTWQLDPLEV